LGEIRTRVAMFRGESEAAQLDLIFQVTGYPTGETLRKYEAIEQWPTFAAINTTAQNAFQARFGGAGKSKVLERAGLDLLQRMLDLDPDTRITAGDALKHEYFQEAFVDPNRCVFDSLIVLV